MVTVLLNPWILKVKIIGHNKGESPGLLVLETSDQEVVSSNPRIRDEMNHFSIYLNHVEFRTGPVLPDV